MNPKLDIELTLKAYSHNFDCHISYSLNDFERDKPEVLADLIKTIELQMEQHIEMKKRNHGEINGHEA